MKAFLEPNREPNRELTSRGGGQGVMNAECHYHDRMRVFQARSAEPGGIVMVGSSHVERFDAATLLPGRRIVNRGIAGDRLDVAGRGVLHRLEVSVFTCRPAAVVFESGANDLGELSRHGRPAMEEIVATYRRAVGAIRERLPEVPLLLVGAFPTRGAYAELSPLVPRFNAHLRPIAVEYRCECADVSPLLADHVGELGGEFTEDGLHLNERGYRVWARDLAEWLQRLPLRL